MILDLISSLHFSKVIRYKLNNNRKFQAWFIVSWYVCFLHLSAILRAYIFFVVLYTLQELSLCDYALSGLSVDDWSSKDLIYAVLN